MRDKLIHGYFSVDYKLVWDSIKIEIPNLKPKIKNILDDFDSQESQKTDNYENF